MNAPSDGLFQTVLDSLREARADEVKASLELAVANASAPVATAVTAGAGDLPPLGPIVLPAPAPQ